jgi:hypothetical protein
MMNVCAALVVGTMLAAPSTAETAPGVPAMLAQDQKAAKATVAGRWNMSVKSPHGDTSMTLTLEQNGRIVTGAFNPHGDDLKVEGEFADGALTLATTGSTGPGVTFKARLKDDGTLEGFLSSEMGDMTWTARRVTSE